MSVTRNGDVYPTLNEQQIRTFATGATRNADTDKIDYEGFLCPRVLQRFGEYMHSHRKQADGNFRESDNWQKGIPIDQYRKSLIRHVHDVWMIQRGWGLYATTTEIEEALCGVIFNSMGMLHEISKGAE